MSLAAISWEDIERVFKFVAAFLAVVAFILLLVQLRRSGKLSAYALPDRVPVWDGSELPAWHASCMYAGTIFVAARAWLFWALSVRGRGFEKRGKGTLWLANEALFFKRKGRKTPIAIPLALIHEVQSTPGTTSEAHRWISLSHGIANPAMLPLFFVFSLLPQPRVRPRKGAPSNFVRIVWGRKELPVVSEFQVSKEVEVTKAWAQEIGRRAKAWKDGNRRSA
jgi:hypothetical protein